MFSSQRRSSSTNFTFCCEIEKAHSFSGRADSLGLNLQDATLYDLIRNFHCPDISDLDLIQSCHRKSLFGGVNSRDHMIADIEEKSREILVILQKPNFWLGHIVLAFCSLRPFWLPFQLQRRPDVLFRCELFLLDVEKQRRPR